MKLKESTLSSGVVITMLGSGTSKVLMIVATYLCAHLLNQEDFGSFSFLRNSLNMILVVCALNYIGLSTKFTTESQFSSAGKYKLLILFLFTIVICLVGSIFLFIFPNLLLGDLSNSENVIFYIKILAILLPLFILQPLVEGILRGQKRFLLIGKLQIITSLFFVVSIALFVYFYGLLGAIFALLLYYILYSVVSIAIIGKTIKGISKVNHIRQNCIKYLPILGKVIIPIFLLSFIEAPINWWAQVIMAKEDSFSAIGSMTIILQIRNLALLIPTYYFNTFTSFSSTLYAANDYNTYFGLFKKSILSFTLISIGGVVLISVFNQPLLGVFGDVYKQDSVAYIIAMLGIPFLILGNLLKIHLLIFEKQRLILAISVLTSSAFISSMYLFLGFGISCIISYFLAQLLQAILLFIFCIYSYLKDRRIYHAHE